ncbi:hypothetical protein HLI18_18570 [Rhizobium laguerreae]|uniref:hypothetical protein n=1 Tax=Rhizobium laguerreae TaxID=1076926 RepID=UPI001478147B|nr:hypothetical protein [Rhizobium laguerreae]NNG71898.1 hypothetical protein [Rhizobium laguerreae]
MPTGKVKWFSAASKLKFCQNVLQRFDDDRSSMSLACKLVDDVSDKIVKLLKQPFRTSGLFGHDRRSFSLRLDAAANLCTAQGAAPETDPRWPSRPRRFSRTHRYRRARRDGCLRFPLQAPHSFEQFIFAHRRETIGETTGIEVCLIGHGATPSIDYLQLQSPGRGAYSQDV